MNYAMTHFISIKIELSYALDSAVVGFMVWSYFFGYIFEGLVKYYTVNIDIKHF